MRPADRRHEALEDVVVDVAHRAGGLRLGAHGPGEDDGAGLAPAGKAVEHALAIARRIAEQPPLAVAVARQAIDAMAESSRDAGLLVERLGYGLLAQTEDAREAATAFTEKRPPRFRGG